jgi:predicted porin
MKKSIIALAVSSAAFASLSAYASEGSTVDVYGNIQYAFTGGDAGSEFTDNGSTFGFKGEARVDEDLTAFFKYELEADADEKTSDIDVNLDQAFVGLKGSFGKVQVGTFDPIYDNAIQDSVDQFEVFGFDQTSTSSEGDTIAYFSPSFGGFDVQVAAQVKGSAEAENSGNALAAVLKYNVDAVTVALGYDSLDNVNEDSETVGLSVAYQVNESFVVTAAIEAEDDVKDIYGLSARYGYGYGDLYASAQSISPEAGDDYEEYAAGVSYNLASNVYVYGEVGQFTDDEDTQTAIGVYYGF